MTFKKQRPSSILGLAFDGNRLEIAALRRTNGHFQLVKTASAQLALSPLTGDPELVGREIRNVLDEAGIREKRCIVGIPLSWMMTLQVGVPEMAEADIPGFLQIEAERGFHSGPEALMLSQSLCQVGIEKQATLLAVPRTNIANLDTALKAAQLKPLSLSPAVSALQLPETSGVLALSVGTASIDLQVACGGGITALRFVEGATESEGAQKRLDADVVAREIRITLGQLPAGFQSSLKKLTIFGRGDLARRFVTDLTPRAEAMGLKIELIERCVPGHFETVLPAESLLSPAMALAVRFLSGAPQPFEFLPPRVSQWQKLVSNRISGRKLAVSIAGACALILLISSGFIVQEVKIRNLKSQITAIAPRVADAEAAQKQIRRFRPWYDESFRSMTILRKLTEAFPENGSVTAKTFEIRESSQVTCSGVAKDQASLRAVLAKMRATKSFDNARIVDTHGTAPVNFTLNFQWSGDSANAN